MRDSLHGQNSDVLWTAVEYLVQAGTPAHVLRFHLQRHLSFHGHDHHLPSECPPASNFTMSSQLPG